MENKSVRVAGILAPPYLNGRSRDMLMTAFAPSAAPAPVVSIDIVSALRDSGIRAGEGVPFAALYMARTKKKVYGLRPAA